jgi:hypothetical protein
MLTLDKKLIKKTHKKLVISGDFIEEYKYELPLYYNTAPDPNRDYSKQNKEDIEERRFYSIKRSRDKIRRLVNSNLSNKHVPKFLTLTFRDDITDLKQARYYYKLFNQKLQYRYPKTAYLGVAEIQKKRYDTYGVKVWHFHIIYFNLPYIYDIKTKLADLWPHGFIKINAISHVKNTGAYVSKYLRKDLYEKELIGEKSFFTSKGLKQPIDYKESINVNNFFKSNTTVLEYSKEYQSCTHGKIIYNVYKKHGNTNPRRNHS